MRKVLIFASVVVCLLFLTSTASASWWNVNWKYRREITITNVNGTLTDYQILVELNSTNFNFSHAQENGSDIRFVASDDETLLSHWIEVWNSTNQSAKIWVNVSEITEGAKIFMYYGNENASDASDVNATFIRVIDGVVGAWYFDEGSGNTACDSSGNGNDGTIYGASWVDGKFGKALRFDGVDDYVKVPNSENLTLTKQVTVTAWIKTTMGLVNYRPAIAGKHDSYFLTIGEYTEDYPRVVGYIKGENKGWKCIAGTTYINDEKWHFAAMTYDNSVLKVYCDGVLENQSTIDDDIYHDTSDFKIGFYGECFNGTIDEVCTYNRALSEEEISDLYNNYGYTTPNYPNKVLVRKYTEPEPVVIIGEEVAGIFTTIANFLTIEKEIGANYILWKWSCTNPDALVDVFVDG
ncbi:MAG: DUF2341 domain-containing protein, partial [Candidatus Thorarchaeota archaeon]